MPCAQLRAAQHERRVVIADNPRSCATRSRVYAALHHGRNGIHLVVALGHECRTRTCATNSALGPKARQQAHGQKNPLQSAGEIGHPR